MTKSSPEKKITPGEFQRLETPLRSRIQGGHAARYNVLEAVAKVRPDFLQAADGVVQNAPPIESNASIAAPAPAEGLFDDPGLEYARHNPATEPVEMVAPPDDWKNKQVFDGQGDVFAPLAGAPIEQPARPSGPIAIHEFGQAEDPNWQNMQYGLHMHNELRAEDAAMQAAMAPQQTVEAPAYVPVNNPQAEADARAIVEAAYNNSMNVRL